MDKILSDIADLKAQDISDQHIKDFYISALGESETEIDDLLSPATSLDTTSHVNK